MACRLMSRCPGGRGWCDGQSGGLALDLGQLEELVAEGEDVAAGLGWVERLALPGERGGIFFGSARRRRSVGGGLPGVVASRRTPSPARGPGTPRTRAGECPLRSGMVGTVIAGRRSNVHCVAAARCHPAAGFLVPVLQQVPCLQVTGGQRDPDVPVLAGVRLDVAPPDQSLGRFAGLRWQVEVDLRGLLARPVTAVGYPELHGDRTLPVGAGRRHLVPQSCSSQRFPRANR